MSVHYSKDPQVDRTLRHSVGDGIAYSIMSGGAETYLSAFALFLKATAPQVALIATLPPLLGSQAQLLSVWLVGQLRERKRLILAGASLQAPGLATTAAVAAALSTTGDIAAGRVCDAVSCLG